MCLYFDVFIQFCGPLYMADRGYEAEGVNKCWDNGQQKEAFATGWKFRLNKGPVLGSRYECLVLLKVKWDRFVHWHIVMVQQNTSQVSCMMPSHPCISTQNYPSSQVSKYILSFNYFLLIIIALALLMPKFSVRQIIKSHNRQPNVYWNDWQWS